MVDSLAGWCRRYEASGCFLTGAVVVIDDGEIGSLLGDFLSCEKTFCCCCCEEDSGWYLEALEPGSRTAKNLLKDFGNGICM